MYDTVNTTGTASDEDLIPIEQPEKVFLFQRFGLLADRKTPAPNQGLRLQVKVPDGVQGKNKQQLNVSNIYDTATGQHIRYGAQFADYVTMSVSAVAIKAPAVAPIPCYNPNQQPAPAAAVSEASFAAATNDQDEEVPVASKISTLPASIGRFSHPWVADSEM